MEHKRVLSDSDSLASLSVSEPERVSYENTEDLKLPTNTIEFPVTQNNHNNRTKRRVSLHTSLYCDIPPTSSLRQSRFPVTVI